MREQLNFESAIRRPDLIPATITQSLKAWQGSCPVEDIWVAPINPDFAGSAEFCQHYGFDPNNGANCVIVEAIRGENRTLAACLIPISCKADLNKTARKILDARRVSFAPLSEVLEKTGMEYGGVTPLGLPSNFKILIDARIAAMDRLIIGGGYRKSKIFIPGKALAELPNALVIEGLGIASA